MTSTEKLNVLFDRWQQSSPENIESFVRDGIINEQKFNSKRVLFLCKEPNQTGAKKEIESSRIWDFREWWKEPLWGGFSICLATWAYGLLSNFNPYDEISDSDLQDAIQCIAFMNIKKTGGLGAAVFQDIHTYVGQHKEYIEEEINIIRPNLIIASITWPEFPRDTIRYV